MIVSTTRPISCLTLRSRSGVPICPRKYFETTMLVACCDQNLGISTSRCSKTTSPFSLPMTADAQVPLDLVERIHAFRGEEAFVFQAGDQGSARSDVSVSTRPPVADGSTWKLLSFHAIPPTNASHTRPHGLAPNENFAWNASRPAFAQEAGRPLVRPSRWPSNMDPVYAVVKR